MIQKLIRKVYGKISGLYKRMQEVMDKQRAAREASAYNAKYNHRKNRKVVYTCLTGNYDDLLQHNFANLEYDYICFTDSEKLLRSGSRGIWKIKPLQYHQLDNTRNARWHKTHPHVLLPDYDESVWVDANIDIKSNYLFSMFPEDEKEALRVPIHDLRTCIYEEAKAVIEQNKEVDTPVVKMLDVLKSENFPANYGLNETNIIYRQHHDSVVIKIMEMWWNYIEKFSKRDQLSFSYVLWKHGITPASISIPNIRNNEKNFRIYQHNR